MTRKHFQALASALNATKPFRDDTRSESVAATRQWRADVKTVADACKEINIQFKRDTFYAWCGMDD